MSMTPNRRMFRLWILVAHCASLLHTASAQIPPGGVKTARFALLPVRIRQDSALTERWKLGHAELRESIIGVWGALDVENASPITMKWAKFYAEYFDEAGRVCFTLVFGSQANAERLEGDDRPIRPGEMRELLSLASDLGPAVEPVAVRVRLIEDRSAIQPLRGGAGSSVIRSPVVIGGTVVEPTIRLKLDESQRGQAMIDLIFSRLRFGSNGNLEDLDILQSSNAEARRWFDGFVHQSRFGYPATSGLANVPGTALLLVRVPNDVEHARAEELLPRSSNWVKPYLRTVRGNDIPPVTQFLLSRSADLIPLPTRLPDGTIQQRERVTDPELFEYISPGSGWCEAIVGWASVSGVPVLTWRWPK